MMLTSSPSFTRRQFIQTSAVLCGGLVVLGSLARAQPPVVPALRRRKDALALAADDMVFQDYARAVRLMHELPTNDPRNWMNQAKIHADHCAHGRASFLPWHRHYVRYFEDICATLLGKPEFALPYWDWTKDRGPIPLAFFAIDELNVAFWKDPGTYDSPVPGGWTDISTTGIRAMTSTDRLQDDPLRGGAFTPRMIDSILAENTFSRFVNRLESTPHNTGHVKVGFAADAIGHMGSGLSPLDPLFWLHHCNVDRLWAQWQEAGNKTPTFGNLPYGGHFSDGTGTKVDPLTADQAINYTSLGYTYDWTDAENLRALAGLNSEAAVSLPLEELRTLGASDRKRTLLFNEASTDVISVTQLRSELAKTRFAFEAALPDRETLPNGKITALMLSQFGRKVENPRRIVAQLKNVRTTFDRDVTVNVFVNCPYLSPTTPFTDRHFAGTFSTFGSRPAPAHGDHGAHGAGHDHGTTDIFVDVTEATRNANVADLSKINLQFMTTAGAANVEPKGALEIGSIEILSV